MEDLKISFQKSKKQYLPTYHSKSSSSYGAESTSFDFSKISSPHDFERSLKRSGPLPPGYQTIDSMIYKGHIDKRNFSFMFFNENISIELAPDEGARHFIYETDESFCVPKIKVYRDNYVKQEVIFKKIGRGTDESLRQEFNDSFDQIVKDYHGKWRKLCGQCGSVADLVLDSKFNPNIYTVKSVNDPQYYTRKDMQSDVRNPYPVKINHNHLMYSTNGYTIHTVMFKPNSEYFIHSFRAIAEDHLRKLHERKGTARELENNLVARFIVLDKKRKQVILDKFDDGNYHTIVLRDTLNSMEPLWFRVSPDLTEHDKSINIAKMLPTVSYEDFYQTNFGHDENRLPVFESRSQN